MSFFRSVYPGSYESLLSRLVSALKHFPLHRKHSLQFLFLIIFIVGPLSAYNFSRLISNVFSIKRTGMLRGSSESRFLIFELGVEINPSKPFSIPWWRSINEFTKDICCDIRHRIHKSYSLVVRQAYPVPEEDNLIDVLFCYLVELVIFLSNRGNQYVFCLLQYLKRSEQSVISPVHRLCWLLLDRSVQCGAHLHTPESDAVDTKRDRSNFTYEIVEDLSRTKRT